MLHTILLLAMTASAHRTPMTTPSCTWPRQCVATVAITGPCPAGRVCVQAPLS